MEAARRLPGFSFLGFLSSPNICICSDKWPVTIALVNTTPLPYIAGHRYPLMQVRSIARLNSDIGTGSASAAPRSLHSD